MSSAPSNSSILSTWLSRRGHGRHSGSMVTTRSRSGARNSMVRSATPPRTNPLVPRRIVGVAPIPLIHRAAEVSWVRVWHGPPGHRSVLIGVDQDGAVQNCPGRHLRLCMLYVANRDLADLRPATLGDYVMQSGDLPTARPPPNSGSGSQATPIAATSTLTIRTSWTPHADELPAGATTHPHHFLRRITWF